MPIRPSPPTIPFNDLGRGGASEGAAIRAAVDRVLASGWFLTGPEVEAFEAEFGARCGAAAVVAVANGTDALELSLRALGVGRGDRVAVAANAGGYGTIATRLVGATPVFVDVDPSSLLITPELLRDALSLTEDVRAVICTHLYGSVVDVDAIREVVSGRGIGVVEDCAQAHDAMLGSRPVGTLGDVAAFSFYPTKNLGALGDAGAVATDDAALGSVVRQLAQYGWSQRFHVDRPEGRNSRMDELQAAVLRVRLEHLGEITARRGQILDNYERELADVLEFPRRRAGSVGHLAVGLHDRRDELRDALATEGIGTAIHYPVPDHHQPGFEACGTRTLPGVEQACRRAVSLPLFPELTDEEVATVCAAVTRWSEDA